LFEKRKNVPEKVYSTFLDITERKRAEDELHNLKNTLQEDVERKTKELKERVAELESFHDATIEREFRINDLHDEIRRLKGEPE
jgi:phage-related protein